MIRVFCDFDGTVAAEDIGNHLFRHFSGPEAERIVEGYLSGTKSAVECLSEECAAAKNVTPEALARFVDGFRIDPHFADFVEFCKKHDIPVAILSDGLDFYVGRVLQNHSLGHIEWYANKLELRQSDEGYIMVASFPYTDSECLQCGNCKRNHMLTMSGDDDIIVYIGDGISDRCPVRYADIVFAKKGLIKYCQEQNITFHEFSTFRDVQNKFRELVSRKRLRKRREAEMARRDVFAQG
jgi:2,3-diketo-5-methylthio-1-phosphopentane phosphatase